MEYSQRLTLDVRDHNTFEQLYAQQYDKGYPLVFEVVENNIPFDLTGVQASFQLMKSDGHIVVAETTVSGNTVTVELDEQMTAAPGNAKFQVVLMTNNQQITTLNGAMRVEPSVINDGDSSATEIHGIEELIEASKKAIIAADEAEASATEAAGYATSASQSASSAQTYSNQASGYATSASSSASSAQSSASSAATSSSNAATSATNASLSESNALSHANDASASATQASASATSAQTYAGNASASATQAQGYANTASGYADSASASATEASGYVDTVVDAASRAATSESNAQTYASNASTSASDAQSSASSASASATSASNSASSASTSADAASTSATNASAHEASALNYSKYAQSYAVGTGGARQGEATDNSMYYYELARDIAHGIEGAMMPMGSIPFARLATADKQPGYVYCITDAFTTDNTFEVGAGIDVSADTSIYCQVNMKWAIMGSDNATSIPAEDIRRLFNH